MAGVTLDSKFKSDVIFNEVSKQFITLKENETLLYNVTLREVLDQFIELMKQCDPIFKACFRRVAYVGSYYEGLKVGKPDEFDLNIIINLPIDYSALQIITAPEKSGYVKLRGTPEMLQKLGNHNVRGMEKFFDPKMYLDQNKFRQWFESVATRAYGRLGSRPCNPATMFIIEIHYVRNDGQMNARTNTHVNASNNAVANTSSNAVANARNIVVANASNNALVNGMGQLQLTSTFFRQEAVVLSLNHKKSGPAWTLKIVMPGGNTVDVDLVPALEFTNPLPKPFKDRHTKKQNWFVISKPLDGPSGNILWRPSFYEKEQDILKGSIKQVIRHMKKFRDSQNLKSICSYYIKTLVLQELEKVNKDFQSLPATFQFYYMLKKLQEACDNGGIYDFWNPRNNLLGKIKEQELVNISNRLSKIIQQIEKRIGVDPYVIAEFTLTEKEFQSLR